MSDSSPNAGLGYLVRLSSQGGWLLLLVVVLSAASAILSVVPFYFLYRMVSDLAHPDAAVLGQWAWWLAWAGMAQILTLVLALTASHIAAFRVLRDLRYALATKLLELPLGWFGRRTSGQTRKVFSEDIEKVENFLAHHISDLVRALVSPLTTLAFLVVADWKLALISLIPALVSPIFLLGIYRGYEAKMGQYYEFLNRMNTAIIEYIRGMGVVRAFNQTAASFSRYKGSVDQYFDFWVGWTQKTKYTYAGFLAALDSGPFFLMALGAPLLFAGWVSVDAFLITLILGPAYIASLKNLMWFSSVMSQNLHGVGDLRTILEAPALPEPATPRRESGEAPGSEALAFEAVDFAYEKTPVLHQVSFEARPGTLTAFVGPSGAGKSTAALLAARFYDPQRGVVRLGGVDYLEWGTQRLMERVALCFQDSVLFRGTIEDNLRMGNTRASFDQVVAAARAARADEFIRLLPQGYQTPVLADKTLSGGQIQRIAIARAILKDAPVVILDEATSYADPENEHLIQQALGELLKDKTVIVVAHRLSTLKNVDQIVVFEEGRVVEVGTWDQLVAQEGTFQRLWQGAQEALDWNLKEAHGDR